MDPLGLTTPARFVALVCRLSLGFILAGVDLMGNQQYRLYCSAHGKQGYYSSNSIIGLFFQVIYHRCYHLFNDKKWMD